MGGGGLLGPIPLFTIGQKVVHVLLTYKRTDTERQFPNVCGMW